MANPFGQIERVMIDKLTGKVAYAVMSFGGFMGIGEDYYPLPWSLLTYNPRLEGYEVNVASCSSGRTEIFQARELGLVGQSPAIRKSPLLRRGAVLGLVGLVLYL
jgi:hypothetical protein